MNPQQAQFLQKTRWLRPLTRWATAFSLATEGWLPQALRNLPLKGVRLLLQRYQKEQGQGCQH